MMRLWGVCDGTDVAPMHQVILEGKTAVILGLGEVGSRIATSCLALVSGRVIGR